MIDIDAEFRKAMGAFCTSSAAAAASTSLDIEALREALRKLPTPPIEIRTSQHVPVLIEARPEAAPRTDDMRAMCDDIGPQMVPALYVFDAPDYLGMGAPGRVAVVNPVHKREGD